MDIAVFGANGQLGRSIESISSNYPKHNFIFTDIDELNLMYASDIEEFVSYNNPDVFINCAAYTAVDMAEQDVVAAMDINGRAVSNLAKIAAEHDIFMVHVSTDYIFDGRTYKPYKEADNVHPLSVYGRTKWKGEVAVAKSSCRHATVRTSWLYSEYRTNFVKTMLRLSAELEQISVVFDQIGTPTYAHDLAKAIMKIVEVNEKEELTGTFNYSNEGVASWYDFAVEIMQLGNRKCKILPITTAEYPTPAKRPHYTVLDKQKIRDTFEITIPHWRDGLKRCMENIMNNSQS